MQIDRQFHFFWKGILSNWATSYFSVGGLMFNCGEQYMMWVKAITFNDQDIAQQILESNNPKYIKDLGRKVSNFNQDIWNNVKYLKIKEGLFRRFTQDLKAKQELLKHKGKIFVEASPYDRIWGIGYSEADALSNVQNWGENLLGKILTELSQEIE